MSGAKAIFGIGRLWWTLEHIISILGTNFAYTFGDQIR